MGPWPRVGGAPSARQHPVPQGAGGLWRAPHSCCVCFDRGPVRSPGSARVHVESATCTLRRVCRDVLRISHSAPDLVFLLIRAAPLCMHAGRPWGLVLRWPRCARRTTAAGPRQKPGRVLCLPNAFEVGLCGPQGRSAQLPSAICAPPQFGTGVVGFAFRGCARSARVHTPAHMPLMHARTCCGNAWECRVDAVAAGSRQASAMGGGLGFPGMAWGILGDGTGHWMSASERSERSAPD